MARFDVYNNPHSSGYLLDVQTDLLDPLNTRVVVPLLPASIAPEPARHLNPLFTVNGQKVQMATQFIAAVPVSLLTDPVAQVPDEFAEITGALDFLFQGF